MRKGYGVTQKKRNEGANMSREVPSIFAVQDRKWIGKAQAFTCSLKGKFRTNKLIREKGECPCFSVRKDAELL